MRLEKISPAHRSSMLLPIRGCDDGVTNLFQIVSRMLQDAMAHRPGDEVFSWNRSTDIPDIDPFGSVVDSISGSGEGKWLT